MTTKPPPSDRQRIIEQNKQLNLIRALREDAGRKKEDAKLAKERVSRAERDLEQLCDDRGQQDLFAGALVLDKKTGEITDYRGIDESEEGLEDRLTPGKAGGDKLVTSFTITPESAGRLAKNVKKALKDHAAANSEPKP